MRNLFSTLFLSLLILSCTAQVEPPKPYGALPTESQINWHKMEYFSLVCYGLNTYTEQEWAYGDVEAKLFKPTDLDTDQWAKVAKDGGMKGLILVAKHHDGFCLWPSKYTDYSVKATPWKNGEGDVLGDLSKSCKKYGLKLGVYLSPWDRNHAEYGGPEYVEYYYKQLEELMTEYGDVFEFWIDGANGGTGYYGGARDNRSIDRGTYYGYQKIFDIVKKHQPNTVIFSDVGPGSRWVGNEKGVASETNWNTISTEGRFPGDGSPDYLTYLGTGKAGGKSWIPAEADTPLSTPHAWYHHTGGKPRSLKNMVDLYYTSIGRGALLNLGLAIAPSGIKEFYVLKMLQAQKHVLRLKLRLLV
jgi:alpha-L-fucosidase